MVNWKDWLKVIACQEKGIEEELKEEVSNWNTRGALQEHFEEWVMNWGEELPQFYIAKV